MMKDGQNNIHQVNTQMNKQKKSGKLIETKNTNNKQNFELKFK